jgi:hypothetical protein
MEEHDINDRNPNPVDARPSAGNTFDLPDVQIHVAPLWPLSIVFAMVVSSYRDLAFPHLS